MKSPDEIIQMFLDAKEPADLALAVEALAEDLIDTVENTPTVKKSSAENCAENLRDYIGNFYGEENFE